MGFCEVKYRHVSPLYIRVCIVQVADWGCFNYLWRLFTEYCHYICGIVCCRLWPGTVAYWRTSDCFYFHFRFSHDWICMHVFMLGTRNYIWCLDCSTGQGVGREVQWGILVGESACKPAILNLGWQEVRG